MDQPLPNMATIYLEYSCPLIKPRLHDFLYILILFQQGLTPSDLQNMDGERIWAVASKTGASGASIFAGMGFIFATWVSYNTKWREWIYTDSPEWQVKNKEGVFRKWQWEYGDFLKQRGINPKFRQAMKHLIHEYSVSPKPYYWEKTTIQNQGLHA